ncbi:MAG: helix-turn-helix domain-containing protein [Verrucomicrobia bacterium]|nr:helix-turn-helix domain-containing protein [Verrucomicrobiota bacterium]
MATLGQQLKAAREAKGVSEHDAGAATKILTKMIVAMEADDFSVMAAPTYAKGFIRLYAEYLGLNSEPLIAEYLALHATARMPLVDEDSQLEKSRSAQPAVLSVLKQALGRIKLPEWFNARTNKLTGNLKPYVVKDIRLAAAGVAGLLVLIVVIVSITNCSRSHHTAKTTASVKAEVPVRSLLDNPLPDLYLVDSGKIESSR